MYEVGRAIQAVKVQQNNNQKNNNDGALEAWGVRKAQCILDAETEEKE